MKQILGVSFCFKVRAILDTISLKTDFERGAGNRARMSWICPWTCSLTFQVDKERRTLGQLDCGLSGPVNFTSLDLICQNRGKNFLSLGSFFIFEGVVLEGCRDLFLYRHFLIPHLGGWITVEEYIFVVCGTQGYTSTCSCMILV